MVAFVLRVPHRSLLDAHCLRVRLNCASSISLEDFEVQIYTNVTFILT